MNLKVKIKLLNQNAKLPVKGSEGAACYDVYASRIEKSEDGYIICHLGFATDIPKGYKGVIVPRSNITKYGWSMLNSPGQVDWDYRNEWQVRFTPFLGFNEVNGEGFLRDLKNVVSIHKSFPYKEGERVAQIYFEKVNEFEFELTDDLSDTKRGLGGFGSTGVK